MKFGQVVRAYVALDDRTSGDVSSVLKFMDQDADDPLTAMWTNISQNLLTLRTRWSTAAIEAKKFMSDDATVDDATKEQFCQRATALNSAAPLMSKLWLQKVGPSSFESARAYLKDDLETFKTVHPDLNKTAESAPVDLDALALVARSGEAKSLFVTWQKFESSADVYKDLCLQNQAALMPECASVKETMTIVSIFTATQALVKKLRAGETRISVTKAAKKNIAESGSWLPSALMLVLDNAGAFGAAPPSEVPVADAVDPMCMD